MQFVLKAFDKPDALPRRLEVIAAHRGFLDTAPAEHGVKVLLSGPLMDDDGETMIGSFFLLEADERADIDAMFANDPLSKADVWGKMNLTPIVIRQNNMGTA